MDIRGPSAEVRYGYQVAATLGQWEATPTITDAKDVFVFKGKVVAIDDYWCTQAPLTLNLRVGRTNWKWDDVTLTRDGNLVHATLVGKPVIEPA